MILVFGLLNTPVVQEYAKDIIVSELKKKIGSELGVGRLYFKPLSTIELDSVYLYDKSNERALLVKELHASVDIIHLLFEKRLVITSAKLVDPDIRLYKESADSTLNIQYVIDAFKSDSSSSSQKIEVQINAVNIVNANVSYDVRDKKQKLDVFDVNHIQISALNSRLAVKSLKSDFLNLQIKKLAFKEKSGFELQNLAFRVITQDKKIQIKGFKLDLPSSQLELDKCEVDLSNVNSNTEFAENAIFECIIAPSNIALSDIAAFVPALKEFDDPLTLQTKIKGSLHDLEITDLLLEYGDNMHLSSNFEIKNIQHPDQTYLLGKIENFYISAIELESIINNFSKQKTSLPPQIANLGNIVFQGDVSGYLDQLTAFGSFETDRGIIKTDVLFGFNSTKELSSYVKGKLYTTDFDIGNTLRNKDLDKISLDLTVDIKKPKHTSIKGIAMGTISNFDYKGYRYSDINLNANYDGLRVDGSVNMEDPNGSVAINGLFDLTDKEHPVLDFVAKFENAQLDDVHIAPDLKQSFLSFVLRANFVGKNIDDAEGYVRIDSIDFIREDQRFEMNNFLIEASGVAEKRRLSIKSDIINGEVLGAYSFSTIANSIQKTIQPYIPALMQEKQGIDSNNKKNKLKAVENKKLKENNLSFNIQINNTEKLSSILKLPVTILSQAKIVGYYNDIYDKFRLELYAPAIKAGGMNIKSGYVLAENPNDEINTQINMFVMGKNNVINDISINSKAANNLINTNITLENNGKQHAKGNFGISTLFSKNGDEPLAIDVGILPSELLLNNTNWKMDKSHIVIKDGYYDVDGFNVFSEAKDQQITIDGIYSPKDPGKTLKTELRNIDLSYIFESLAIDVLKFGGEASGKLLLSSVEGKPYANTNLNVADFKFNGTELGKLDLYSELDDKTNKVLLKGKILSKENKQTDVNGELDPVHQGLSIYFDADSIDISFLKTYAASIFNKVEGRGTGKVHLYGDFSNVTVAGKAFIEKGKVGITFLNTDYMFTDTIYLKENLIYFNNVAFRDKNNNEAVMNGKVAHDMFRNFMYYVDMSAKNFMVYNAPESQNPIFYGQVYGTGKGSISGDEKAVDIDINMRTEPNTTVRMNFMESEVNQYSFVTFKNDLIQAKKDTINIAGQVNPRPIVSQSGMDINMNFYIDATPDAVAEIVMDPVGGDILRGSGTGALQFAWSTKSSPTLYGNFLINRGNYNFTFQKLVEKKFIIQDGSSILFRGDPFQAVLDVNAIYKVTANLNDLDRNIVESTGQTNIPVNCILNLSGPLKYPNVGLDIKFPSADPEVERQIKSLMNTDDMINRQVAYLILLSKFYTPNYANIEHKTSDFAAVASATLSNQLSKIISNIDDRWQVGTNIRTSDSEFTSTEVELLLSSQLLNDRLLINGNFGYRDDPITQDAFIGDVDIEYLLNNSGSWRVKAYNHFNEKYYYTRPEGSSVQTQGVGLIYKKDFDYLRDLLKIRKPIIFRSTRKDSVVPILPDSMRKGSQLSNFVKMKK